MTYLDNPAGRLLGVLHHLRRSARPNNAGKIRGAIAELLNVDAKDSAELLRRWAFVLDLPAQIRSEVAKLPVPEHLTDELPIVEKAFERASLDTNLRAWWQQSNLDAGAMTELRSCSGQLHGHLPETVIDESKLSELRGKIAGLIDQVRNGDLASDLAATLLAHLHDMLRAIDLHHIVGTRELERTLERGAGSVLVAKVAQWRAAAAHPLVMEFFAILTAIGLLLGVPADIKTLTDGSSPTNELPAEIIEGETAGGGGSPASVN